MKRWVLEQLAKRAKKPLQPLEPPARPRFRWLEAAHRALPVWLRPRPKS